MNYRVSGLGEGTPTEDWQKLVANLASVRGVDEVSIDCEHGMVGLAYCWHREPSWARLERAVSRAGFLLITNR